MVKIPSYDDMKKVQMSDQGAQGFSGGQIQVASDTGLTSFGRGMQNMGETMAKIEVDKMKKEATLWNSNSYEKVFKEYNEWQDKQEIDYDKPGAKGFTTSALAKFQELSDKYLGEAPNKYAIQEWKQRMNSFKMTVFKQATTFEAAETLAYQKDQLDETVNNIALRAANEPEGWDSAVYQNAIKDIINGLDTKETDAIEGYANIWSKKNLKAAEDKALAYIAETMIESAIAEGDPFKIGLMKEYFEAGRFAKVLDADKHQALKNKLYGIKGAVDKELKRQFEVKIEDNLSGYKDNGKPVHEITEAEFKHFYGDNNAQWGDYQRKVKIGNTLYTHTQAISTMDLEGMSKYIENLPGTTVDEKLIKSEMAKMASSMVELMQSDSVLYAQKYRPDIYNKIQSEDKATRMQGYFSLLEMQDSFGIRGEDLVLLGDSERSRLVQTFMDATIADKESIQAFVIQLKDEYGDYFDDVMAELIIHGKLDKNVAAAMMYINDPDFGQIFEAARKQIDKNNLADGDMKIITESIQSTMLPIRQALTKTNANAISMVDGWQNVIEKMVMLKVAQGEDVNQAVKDVTKQFLSDKFHIGEDFIVPKTNPNTKYDISQFKSVANNTLETLNQSGLDFEILQAGNVTLDTIGQNTGQYKSIQNALRSTNTKWRNTPDGKGIELVYDFGENGYYPVYFNKGAVAPDGKGGKQKIILDFDTMREKIENENIKVMEDVVDYHNDIPYIRY